MNFILPPIPKVYSYRRVSGPRQIWGTGLKRQEDGVIAVEAVSKEYGLPVDDTLSLVDRGLSGFTGANLSDTAALGMYLKMVENSEIARGSILCIEALDRLTRDEVPEALHLFLSIQRNGVRIYTWGDKKLYSWEGMAAEPTLLIVSIVILMRANNESVQKGQRIRTVTAQPGARMDWPCRVAQMAR